MYQAMLEELTKQKQTYDDLVYITIHKGQRQKYQEKADLYKNMINLIVCLEMIFNGE